MPRQHGTGRIYIKWGAYYGRWRTLEGRYVNRKLGDVRTRTNTVGISRTEANRLLRGLIEAESKRTPTVVDSRPRTVDEVAAELRDRLIVEGARLSYRQNCESMQRVHITPVLGKRRLDSVKSQDVERLARTMLAKGLAPKTVRNVMTFLYAVFALAVEKESGDIAGLALLVARAGHDATSPHANRGKGLAGGCRSSTAPACASLPGNDLLLTAAHGEPACGRGGRRDRQPGTQGPAQYLDSRGGDDGM